MRLVGLIYSIPWIQFDGKSEKWRRLMCGKESVRSMFVSIITMKMEKQKIMHERATRCEVKRSEAWQQWSQVISFCWAPVDPSCVTNIDRDLNRILLLLLLLIFLPFLFSLLCHDWLTCNPFIPTFEEEKCPSLTLHFSRIPCSSIHFSDHYHFFGFMITSRYHH